VSDIGYAGYFNHAASGLQFALDRAFDPVHARWLNRDPISEAGGVNLYAYVTQNPVTYNDPSGDCPLCAIGIGAIVGALASGITTYAETGSLTEAGEAALSGGVAGAAAVVGFLAAPETVLGAIVGAGFDLAISAAGDLGAVGSAMAPGGQPSTPCN
jgi:RHS repeat-associated protein